MAKFSYDKTKIKDLIEDPAALEVLNKYMPGFSENIEKVKPVLGMTLKQIARFPQTKMNKEAKAGLQKAIDALE